MSIQTFWRQSPPGARVGLAAGTFAIVALTIAFAWWAFKPDYQVLFGDLAPQDAAAMAAELDKAKTPYKLGEDGTSILVDRADVYKTRLKLMGKELPLRGAVGFELFNNSDFGQTEFAQKINYQRALQGEITRTILSLSQVRDARVILVMPEQGLFRQSASKAKASITLTLRPGQALRPEQVTGIQRLVSSSVPGIAPHDVTILDQSGVALSRPGGSEGDAEAGSGRLDLKKETENYLARKADEVLARAFGPGEAMVSVDVVLNADRAQVTTEDVVVPPTRAGGPATGVVVRERETVREPPTADPKSGEAAAVPRGSSQRETEYAVGRRVEQVVSQPGTVRRLQAVAVVRRALDAPQQEQIRRVVAAAVGASLERGDTVVVHTLDAALLGAAAAAGLPTVRGTPVVGAMPDAARGTDAASGSAESWSAAGTGAIGAIVVVALGLMWWTAGRARSRPAQQPLTVDQRQALLTQVRGWVVADQATARTPAAAAVQRDER